MLVKKLSLERFLDDRQFKKIRRNSQKYIVSQWKLDHSGEEKIAENGIEIDRAFLYKQISQFRALPNS